MSITWTSIENSELLEKANKSARKISIRVDVSSAAFDQYPYPPEYRIPSCFLPKAYSEFAYRFHDFEVRSDDIFVTTFLKSGTTWTMNIVRKLMNNLDFSEKYLPSGYSFLEKTMIQPSGDSEQMEKEWSSFADFPSPRLIKTHLPAQLLPKAVWTVKPKLIYVFRDAKDVAVSLYHFYRANKFVQYNGTMDDFFDAFLNGLIEYGPHYTHINSYLQLNQMDNVLILSYEEMTNNTLGVVKQISDFLGYKYTDEQLKQLVEHVSFENMRKNNVVEPYLLNGFNFFRKGKVGGYRDEMSSDYIQKFDEMTRRNDIKKINLLRNSNCSRATQANVTRSHLFQG